ncbi:hypothetical protein [Winogradskyella sp.]|uniref:hypothetical protein n=1 Tax=Winogradskyella sp. TaxID=1883156 RepID=UPI003BAB33F4
MKKEHIKDIFDRYKNGQTSLEEEEFLLKNSCDLDFPLSDWIIHEKQNKTKATEDFNDQLWASFNKKIKPKNSLAKRTLIAAAAVVLFFAVYKINQQEQTQSLWEKEALLIQAKSMFSESEQKTNQEIVFEDDLITIYTTTE